MANIIKSVSVTEEESYFLKDFQLSPTQLLKEKIWEMRGMFKKIAQSKIDRMEAIIREQLSRIDYYEDVLEKNGIEERYPSQL